MAAFRFVAHDGSEQEVILDGQFLKRFILRHISLLFPGESYGEIITRQHNSCNGDNIHGTGIDPDVEVELEEAEDNGEDQQSDLQLEKALELLKQ
jgi:C-terminal processing protease CtpA/Prc